MGQRGFGVLYLVIGIFVLIIAISAGFFLGQKTTKQDITQAQPKIEATAVPNVAQAPSPKPLGTKPPDDSTITIVGVFQPACTSTSCKSTTTIVVNGLNFAEGDVLTAKGQDDSKDYTGTMTLLNNEGTQVIYDFHDLPCQGYEAFLQDPTSAAKSANFSFNPTGC